VGRPDVVEHARRHKRSRVLDLIQDCARDPYTGIGKPEPLKYIKPYWSRRIDKTHRLIYETSGKDASHQIMIVACRGHYT
jgi:toxin YoeB